MSILRTRFIVPIVGSLTLSAGPALAAEGHGGGFHGAMGAPHVEGHVGGGQHFGASRTRLGGFFMNFGRRIR